MSEREVKLRVSADNRQLITSFSKSEAKIKSFGNRITGTMSRAGSRISGFGRKIGGLTTLIGGLSVAAIGKGVIDLDSRLIRLANQTDMNKKQMFELKEELFAFGVATHQDPGKLLEGIEQIVEKTGNFEFATKALKDMGIVASATGAQVSDIGAASSDLQEKFKITHKELFTVFDVLSAQGKEGAFTLEKMANLFPKLLSSAAAFGVTGVKGLRQFGAFLQMAMRGAGTPEEAATAVERTFSNIIDKYKVIRKLTGFNVFDPEKSKKAGYAIPKQMDVVLKEIIKRTKGDITKLQKIFGQRSIRAIKPLAQSFHEFGDFREFDAFIKKGGEGLAVMKDFNRWAEGTAARLQNLSTEGKKFANQNLAKPIETLNSALETLNENPALARGGLYALLGLGGLAVGAALLSPITKMVGFAGRRVAARTGAKAVAGRAGGGLLSGLSGPMPVYVVNKHLSMLPSQWMPGAAGTAGAAGVATKAGKMAGLAKKGGLVAASGAAGYGLGTLIEKTLIKGWYGKKLADMANKGEFSRKEQLAAEALARAYERKTQREANNNITLNVRIDKGDRVFSESDDMNTKTSVNVNRGTF